MMMTVPLTGCFGNSDDDDDDKPGPVTPPVLNEWSVHFVLQMICQPMMTLMADFTMLNS